MRVNSKTVFLPSMSRFSKRIIRWYHQHKRDLPWRNTTDPYLIWLSEVILQQTRVDQGMDYYLKFKKEFPTVTKLALAKEDKVLKLWQGLGYYSRARNLHAAAKTVHQLHKGKFPDQHHLIRDLKGVGDYTAAAIASFAFNLPYPVVDGNVYRVLSRVFGLETPIDSVKGKREFLELAGELMDPKDPATYNQAVMEFGALQCKPQQPDCGNCVLNDICLARSKKLVHLLPVKAKKTKVRKRYFNYLVIRHKHQLLFRQRTEKDIWTRLYEFPMIESDRLLNETELLGDKEFKKRKPSGRLVFKALSPVYKHQLSHQQILARFWEFETTKALSAFQLEDELVVTDASLAKYAIPRLIDLYLQNKVKPETAG